MRIREANEADAEAIARLHAASWRTAYRGALSDDYLDGRMETERIKVWQDRFEKPAENQYVAVAESQGRIVGFVCAYGGHDAQWGTFLDNLHVAPELKRQGIGRQLMSTLASWATRAYPGQGVYLWVLQSNAAAHRFYERMGGKDAGSDVWIPPDGSALSKIRIAWRDSGGLLANNAS
jgi:ribosomal protein S18 acetylase RimI-like enzyme